MISDENKMDDLKKMYSNLRNKKDGSHIQFLESIVNYCKYIGFDEDKTLTMIGQITGCEPGIGQKWTDMRVYDDDEVMFNRSVKDILKK
jgi:hypothetical protein